MIEARNTWLIQLYNFFSASSFVGDSMNCNLQRFWVTFYLNFSFQKINLCHVIHLSNCRAVKRQITRKHINKYAVHSFFSCLSLSQKCCNNNNKNIEKRREKKRFKTKQNKFYSISWNFVKTEHWALYVCKIHLYILEWMMKQVFLCFMYIKYQHVIILDFFFRVQANRLMIYLCISDQFYWEMLNLLYAVELREYQIRMNANLKGKNIVSFFVVDKDTRNGMYSNENANELKLRRNLLLLWQHHKLSDYPCFCIPLTQYNQQISLSFSFTLTEKHFFLFLPI